MHPVWLVPAEGDARRVEGHRDDVADAIATIVVDAASARAGYLAPTSSELQKRVASCADAIGIPADGRAIRVRAPDASSHLLDTVEGVDAILMIDEAFGRFDAEIPVGTAPSDEDLIAMRRAAWRSQGVAVLRPEDVRDDWTRHALINEANRLYGRRPGHPR